MGDYKAKYADLKNKFKILVDETLYHGDLYTWSLKKEARLTMEREYVTTLVRPINYLLNDFALHSFLMKKLYTLERNLDKRLPTASKPPEVSVKKKRKAPSTPGDRSSKKVKTTEEGYLAKPPPNAFTIFMKKCKEDAGGLKKVSIRSFTGCKV